MTPGLASQTTARQMITQLPPTTVDLFSVRKECTSNKSKDILYMVDSTVRVTTPILQKMKSFISYSMARFNELDRQFMMGVMQFSDANSAKVIRKVSPYKSEFDLATTLRNMRTQRGANRLTGEALTEASKMVSF